jgi:hypothetical protein
MVSFLRLGRTMRRCLRFGRGLCVLLFGSPTFFWSYDTYDCFQVRARILNPCVGVPSNQPPLAGLM